MSEDNSALSVTLKAGEGFEAPWLNVRADDPETLRNRLNSVLNSDLATLIAQAGIAVQSGYNTVRTLGAQPIAVVQDPTPVATPQVAQVVQFPGPVAVAQQTPPAPQPSSNQKVDKWGNIYTWGVPGAPSCPHGVRVLKQGKQKNGTPYNAYVCPQMDQFFRTQTDCKAQYQQ